MRRITKSDTLTIVEKILSKPKIQTTKHVDSLDQELKRVLQLLDENNKQDRRFRSSAISGSLSVPEVVGETIVFTVVTEPGDKNHLTSSVLWNIKKRWVDQGLDLGVFVLDIELKDRLTVRFEIKVLKTQTSSI